MSTPDLNHAARDWKVLLIDDDVDNLGVLQQYFDFLGAEVKTAREAAEGLKILEDFTPTFVLLDLSMPQMDGWEMLKIIRSNDSLRSLPMIALTAHAMEGDREKVLEAGFDAYISKPIILPTLLSDISAILAASAARRERPVKTNKPESTNSAGKAAKQAKPTEESHASQQS